MAIPQSWADLIAAFDAETTRIANKIQELLDKIAAGGMSAAEEAETQAGIQAQVDRLRTIGADQANPIP